jgi:septal ring factor EnvC (AmiA/AmiB activator)
MRRLLQINPFELDITEDTNIEEADEMVEEITESLNKKIAELEDRLKETEKQKEDLMEENVSLKKSITSKDTTIKKLKEEVNKPIPAVVEDKVSFVAKDYNLKDAEKRWKDDSIYVIVDGVHKVKGKDKPRLEINFRRLNVDASRLNIIRPNN